MYRENINGQHPVERPHTSKCRAPPPPRPPASSSSSSSNGHAFKSRISSTLPATFISSLRQLFSILDKTKSGHVSFDVFKRYWTPSFSFDQSTSTFDILHELEMESKARNYLITFDLLLTVIERSLSLTKHPSPPLTTASDSSLSSLSTPSILIPKATRPAPPISFPVNRSTSVVVATTPTTKKIEQPIPLIYRSYNGMETKHYHSHESTSIPVRHRKKVILQRNNNNKGNGNISSDHPLISTRRNTIHSNEIDFAMVSLGIVQRSVVFDTLDQ